MELIITDIINKIKEMTDNQHHIDFNPAVTIPEEDFKPTDWDGTKLANADLNIPGQ